MKSIIENVSDATIEISDEESSVSLSGDYGLSVDLQNASIKKFSIEGEQGILFSIDDTTEGEIFKISSKDGDNLLSVNTGSEFNTVLFCENTLSVTDRVSVNGNITCIGNVINYSLFNTTDSQTINGKITFSDDITFIGTNNTSENQTTDTDTHILTRLNSIYDDVYRCFTVHNSIPILGIQVRSGTHKVFCGGASASVGSTATAISSLIIANNFTTYEGSGASLNYNNFRFLLSSIYGFKINRNSSAYFRVYIGHNGSENTSTPDGLVRTIPFAGEDPLPPRTRSIGFEVRCNAEGEKQIRLFSRDGYGLNSSTIFNDGLLIFSDWITFGDDSQVNDLTHVIVEFGIDRIVKLYINNLETNTQRSRTSMTPVAELSGEGVPPTDNRNVSTNWSRIIAVVVGDAVNANDVNNQRLTLRDSLLHFL
jgi:hypothetical protein